MQSFRAGRFIPKESSMSSTSALPPSVAIPTALPRVRVIWLMSITVFLALAGYYFVGIDEGMTSVFGKTLMVHEWVHDARHFLGFPCH
jgi:hypothetical protein